ncbi:MAG: TonB-dependent receptor [Betaproteobacteria bacterium]|nr:TonB-dependent receptor [Betaproteobacteria bacterium]
MPVTVGEEVVVTATRFKAAPQDLPAGVTVITAEDIRNSTAANIPELLQQVPGIQVRDSAGSPNQQVDMRGFGIFGDQNTLVLLDGQRISENEQVTVNWTAIPLSSIERIEIMRGSGAVLYGGGATGGTINVITKAPQKSTRSGYLGAGVGSYNTGDYRAGFNLAGEKIGLIVNAGHLESDNYRDSNRLRQQNAQADLRYTGERGTLYAKFGGDDQRLLLPNALTEAQIAVNRRQAAAPFGSYANMNGGYVNLGGELKVGAADFALNGGFRGRESNAKLFLITKNSVTVASLTPRMKLPFALAGTRHTLVAGMDWEDWDSDGTAAPTAFSTTKRPLSIQRNRAVYIQDSIALTSATVLSAGVRFHRSTFATSDIASGTAGSSERNLRAFEVSARHRFGETVAVYGKFGNSFRISNVNDNYSLFTGTIAQLEPQTSHDREIGTELQWGRTNFRLAVYQMDISNEIHFDPTTFANVNLPPTRRRGLELEGKGQFTATWSGFANYTLATARFREGAFANNDVPLVPRHAVKAGTTWEFMPRTRVSALAAYTGEQVFDGDEANTFGRKMPSYTLVDAKLSHEYRGWLFDAGVKNLFNQKYFSYGIFTGFPTFSAYPAPERSVFVSAQFTYK